VQGIYAPNTSWDFQFTALHFLGFSLYRPLDGKKTLSNASTAIENQTFGAGVSKKFNNNNVIICPSI